MEVLKGLRNLNPTEGKYHDSKALIACNSGKVVHLVKSFHVTSVTKNGCTWANLPHDLPPYSTVYFYFQRWTKTGAERTFAWIGKYCRLSKEYEFYEYTSESFIYLALIRKMLRNLTAVNS